MFHSHTGASMCVLKKTLPEMGKFLLDIKFVTEVGLLFLFSSISALSLFDKWNSLLRPLGGDWLWYNYIVDRDNKVYTRNTPISVLWIVLEMSVGERACRVSTVMLCMFTLSMALNKSGVIGLPINYGMNRYGRHWPLNFSLAFDFFILYCKLSFGPQCSRV